ncbi:MAG: tetratricopeptide repeat protein [Acidobacteriaceae bacterium]
MSRPIRPGKTALRAILATTLGAAILAAACTARAQSEDQKVQKILLLLRLDEYGRSLQSVNQMLAYTPHDCRLLSLRGMALNGLGKPDEALRSYQSALRYCPSQPLALQNAAQMEYARQRPDAVGYLNRLLKLNPKNQAAHAMLASIDRANGKCVQALPHFHASSQLFSGQPQYQQAYAFCLAKTGHNRQAAANYQQILSADSDPDSDLALRYNFALVQYRLHHLAAALATLKPLLATSHNPSVQALGAQLKQQITSKAGAHPGTQKPAPHFALIDEKAHGTTNAKRAAKR